jgi:glycopeptide antibiotics resistance protein
MHGFLMILFIVLGYLGLLGGMMARLGRNSNVAGVAAAVLLIYGCGVGMAVAAGRYLGGAGLLLYTMFLVYSLIFWPWKLFWSVKHKPRLDPGVLMALISYILAVLYVTVFMRTGGTNFTVQMELFNWTKEDGLESVRHILLNGAMFVPVGIGVPLLTEKGRGKLLTGASFGLLLSVVIETGQLILHSGTCDIDDMIFNTLGSVTGAVMARAWLYARRRPQREGFDEGIDD